MGMVLRMMAACIKGNSLRIVAICICSAALLCMRPASALSGVIVDDMVVVKGQKVMLRAETRGRIFSKGGELVEFFVDGKSIGRTLSGGDGVAFLLFVPAKTGLYEISARSGSDEDRGSLLSLKTGSRIVFIDIEDSLVESVFSRKPKQGSQKAVKEIKTSFPIVFLQTSFIGVRAVKIWLREKDFIEAPVLPWRQGEIFDEIVEKGFRIKAIVAGPKVIESAKEHKPLGFCFEEVDEAEQVKDWDEIRKKLK